MAAALPATGLVSSATAAPGNPGTPSAPTVVFSEGFGTGLASGELSKLADYAGGKYTADPAWLSAAAGNGLVIDGTTTDADQVTAGYTAATGAGVTSPTKGGELRELATILGALNGTSPDTANHAVTAYTDANPGANLVEFQTKNLLPLNADGRFLTISANVAVSNCVRASAPLLKFYLVDAGTENVVNNTALNPCTGAPSDAPRAVTLTGGNAVLFDADQVGIALRNENGSGGGNDHAYDDVKVLDVTPQLDKDFVATGDEQPGDPVDLVFTVTNTSELGGKSGWSFTDKLSPGLEVAGDATSTCAAGDVTAVVGATSIKVENGDLASGEASCTITVPVTADAEGTYKNGPENITSRGLDKPAVTEVVFTAPATPGSPEPVLPETGAPAAGNGDLWMTAGGAGLAVLGLTTVAIASRRKRTAL
ncbi:hypothetical protein EFK50_18675 [Nocardioides marmoriginsengisoli]|uniref:DUF7933 domain-containing protein n=2 Tax=Nocardioides marmoriginsengisoli TaxID=661483 RepID=A0A3N0CAX9_9ACTN|nr:hypothetical protein EFK50_18675 [Nocardioides marmoriginsengisoli]